LRDILRKELTYQIVENATHNVACIDDLRMGIDFRKKFKEKYNVLIVKTATISKS